MARVRSTLARRRLLVMAASLAAFAASAQAAPVQVYAAPTFRAGLDDVLAAYRQAGGAAVAIYAPTPVLVRQMHQPRGGARDQTRVPRQRQALRAAAVGRAGCLSLGPARAVAITKGTAMENARKFHIDGAWVDPVTPAFLAVIDPSTEEAFEEIAMGSAADVDRAVAAA